MKKHIVCALAALLASTATAIPAKAETGPTCNGQPWTFELFLRGCKDTRPAQSGGDNRNSGTPEQAVDTTEPLDAEVPDTSEPSEPGEDCGSSEAL